MTSYSNAMRLMKQNPTDGTEFGLDSEISLENNVKISRTHCEYCENEILAVWDNHNTSNWWPYLGNQARKPKTYFYSPIIQKMREYYNVVGEVWDNPLLNVHARCHSTPTNWSKRASDASIRILCNSCFQKTYKRIKVQGNDGILYSLSVLEERGETIESVMKDLDIQGEIVGKGGIIDYD